MKNYITAIIISVGFVGAVLIYSNGVSERQERQIEWQRDQKLTEQVLRAECEQAARDSYSAWWETECERLELGTGCALPTSLGDRLNKLYQQNLDRCQK